MVSHVEVDCLNGDIARFEFQDQLITVEGVQSDRNLAFTEKWFKGDGNSAILQTINKTNPTIDPLINPATNPVIDPINYLTDNPTTNATIDPTTNLTSKPTSVSYEDFLEKNDEKSQSCE